MRRYFFLRAACTTAFLVTSISVQALSEGDPSTPSYNTNRSLRIEAPGPPESYKEALALIGDLPRQWNKASGPLVRDYLDPNVPAEQWVREGSRLIGDLRAVHLKMQAQIMSIREREVREFFLLLNANYRAKLDSVTLLHIAVARGDEQAEVEAYQRLGEASQQGQQLSAALVEKIRPLVSPRDFEASLSKGAEETARLMTPRSDPQGKQAQEDATSKNSESNAGGLFVVQLAALLDPVKAEALRARAIQAGFTAYTEKIGNMTLVRVGPYRSHEAALAASGLLAERGLLGIVLRH